MMAESASQTSSAIERCLLYGGVEHRYSLFAFSETPSNKTGRLNDIANINGNYWYYGRSGWLPAQSGGNMDHPTFDGVWTIVNGNWAESNTRVGHKRPRDGGPSKGLPLYQYRPTSPLLCTWLKDAENDWLSLIYDTKLPLLQTGREIFTNLYNLSSTACSPGAANHVDIVPARAFGTVLPSLNLLLVDLLHDEDFQATDFISGEPVADMQVMDFMANMYRPLFKDDRPDACQLYGALNIPVSDNGLGLCSFDATPYSHDAASIVDDSAWLTVWTSPGAISQPHMDHYGATQYFVHLFGQKLWLTWPPTPHNLVFLDSLHRQKADLNRTKICLENLEKLEFFLVKEPGRAFVLKPNTIHACMSISGSCHSAIRVWSLDHWEESCRLMRWGIQWLTKQFEKDHIASNVTFDIEKLEDEIEQWKTLERRGPKSDLRLELMLKEVLSIAGDVIKLKETIKL